MRHSGCAQTGADEGGNGARVSAAFGIDFVLIVFALVGIGGLALRFNKRESDAL